ncbi:hypothetical protein FDECE_7534 [Fusarium decemcellulare]|nr:hypothetical protein FDECE_7534 [Fusarium decemcellulare]
MPDDRSPPEVVQGGGSGRHLFWAAVHYGVLHPQQAETLSKRPATDLMAARIHDIKEAFDAKRCPQCRFGYADGTAILSIGNVVEETAATASSSVEDMVRWSAANGVSFDPKKAKAMHFFRSKLKIAPAIHVENWAVKGQAVAYHLRGLTDTKQGPLLSAVRSAAKACVEPVLLHISEAWYPGTSRLRWGQPTRDVSSSNQHLKQRLKETLNQATKAILPVWKTTFITILHRESGIPPVGQLLEAQRLRFSARLKSLDHTRPLTRRTIESLDPLTLVAYSDASLSSEGAASYSSTIHQDNITILGESGRIGPAEVFDAKARGALEGLKATASQPPHAHEAPRFTPFETFFLGHTDIPDNEQADKLARVASFLPEPEDARPTLETW